MAKLAEFAAVSSDANSQRKIPSFVLWTAWACAVVAITSYGAFVEYSSWLYNTHQTHVSWEVIRATFRAQAILAAVGAIIAVVYLTATFWRRTHFF